MQPAKISARPHVVVIGAGFGGLAATRRFYGEAVDVTVIDQRNHHLFQPLLYQVATAALSPADIAAPIRSILRDQDNVRVVLDGVVAIDTDRQFVALASGMIIAFDWLIVATGARHSFFGRDDWEPHASGLKTIEDATAIRRKVLLALERAETETNKQRRQALLTFVVIGGGPTGVEMAGAIAELAHRSVNRDFRSITPHCSRVVLINQADRLLEAFPPDLSERALGDLTRLGVEVRLSTRVNEIGPDFVEAGGDRIDAYTIIWAAGVQASPAASWLDVPCDTAGRVHVDAMLRTTNSKRVFVIGDTANCSGPDGRPLPGIAPVAKQQGEYVARAILATISGCAIESFRYRHRGNLATIGRSHAVADFGRIKIKGWFAWLLWSTVHVYFLVGFRNRLSVGLSLAWNYLTFARHARLITGDATVIPYPAGSKIVRQPAKGAEHVRLA